MLKKVNKPTCQGNYSGTVPKPSNLVQSSPNPLYGPYARVFRSLHSLPTQAPQPLRSNRLRRGFELTELN